jgi:hypothetical protein
MTTQPEISAEEFRNVTENNLTDETSLTTDILKELENRRSASFLYLESKLKEKLIHSSDGDINPHDALKDKLRDLRERHLIDEIEAPNEELSLFHLTSAGLRRVLLSDLK